LDRKIQVSPADPALYFERAKIFGGRGQTEKASEFFLERRAQQIPCGHFIYQGIIRRMSKQ
jgi:hypothetical protein